MFSYTNIPTKSAGELFAGKIDRNHAGEASDDNDDTNSIQSMLAMMMTKHKSPSPLLLQGGNDNDDDVKDCGESIAQSIESYDFIALSSLKNKSNSRNNHSENHPDGDVESTAQSIEINDVVSSSCLTTELTSSSRTSLTNERRTQEHCDDEEKLMVQGGLDKNDDIKTTTSNTTKNTTPDSSSSSSSQSGSTTSSRFQGRSRRFKCVLALALFLALLLFAGIGVLGYALYAIKNDDDKALSLFTVDFWTVEVKNTITFWKKEDEPGEDYLSMIDGEE